MQQKYNLDEKWLPDDKQYNLLIAATSENKLLAVKAWQAWQAKVEFDAIDSASYGFIPKLYRNLARHDVEETQLRRYKGIYRATWVQNHEALYQFSKLLQLFYANNIDKVILLKGAGLALYYYQDVGVRPMGDIDILIQKSQVRKCIDLLLAQHWQPVNFRNAEITDEFIDTRHALGFVNKHNSSQQLDLHWHLLPEISDDNFTAKIFASAIAIKLHDIRCWVPCPEHMLAHVLIHGAKASIVSLIRWVLDANEILKKHSFNLNWDLFIATMIECRGILCAKQALVFLQKYLNLSVPESVTNKLNKLSITTAEKREFYLRTARYTNYYIASAAAIWYKYKVISQKKSLFFLIMGFPIYLKRYWGLKNNWLLPKHLINKFIQTAKKINYVK